MEAHRQLVRDGLLLTVDSKGRKEKLHFFLFNDMVVFADKTDVKKQTDMTKLNSKWPLELVWIANVASTPVSAREKEVYLITQFVKAIN